MAEASNAEKTEPASQRRLDQARKNGDIPRSREVATFTVLMTAGAGLWMMGGGLVAKLSSVLQGGLSLDREQIHNPALLMERVTADVAGVILACLPLAAMVMLVMLASPLVIGGWNFSAKSFLPNFGKLNPMRGLGNMVSTNALVELLKAVAKTLLVGAVAWYVVMSQKDAVLGLALEPFGTAAPHLASILAKSFLTMVGSLGAIAILDGPYQIWHYADKLKMTRQEVIQESKESDGNPQIKGKIRQLQREMARKRMMANVPTADVVVTNPTHFAVALKYADGQRGAPRVVAKGTDEVAAKIREIAKENKVALLEAPALARALYKHTDIDDEIPERLYSAVAEVLAYVYQLRAYAKDSRQQYPDRPTRLPVPPEMDPFDPAYKAPGTQAGADTGADEL
ncbi:flagellar type III secretion system protein FlhB [Massilia forsythiae]|uniref:Flagellar biosynthetic protein FlhB n=1 Tax=Massilia forsythiae TaxID=2728020 RepID=A0A7Z2VWQ8_9BURK|nr:flagellar biosynthesis protein FlhB [Massilia forsythiae]QJE00908.1 flagellar type III secretion system protein FlhB [Massilia forsythiae]